MLDISLLEQNMEGDKAVISTLLTLFIEEYQHCTEEVQNHYRAQNATQLGGYCHGLKGMIMGFGPSQVGDMLQQIESTCQQGGFPSAEQVDALVKGLNSYIDEVKQYLCA